MLLDDYGEIEGDAANALKIKEERRVSRYSRNVKAYLRFPRVLYKEFLPRVYQFSYSFVSQITTRVIPLETE